IDPPSLAALEVLTADSVDEMSVRQAVLDIRNDEIAADLTELDELRGGLRGVGPGGAGGQGGGGGGGRSGPGRRRGGPRGREVRRQPADAVRQRAEEGARGGCGRTGGVAGHRPCACRSARAAPG